MSMSPFRIAWALALIPKLSRALFFGPLIFATIFVLVQVNFLQGISHRVTANTLAGYKQKKEKTKQSSLYRRILYGNSSEPIKTKVCRMENVNS